MHYHYTCYEAQAAQNERGHSSTIVSVASTQLVSEEVSQSSQPTTGTTENTEYSLNDSVYEQRMADIEANEINKANRKTEALKVEAFRKSPVFTQSHLSEQNVERATSEQNDGDKDFARISVLNHSLESVNYSTETIEEPFLQK